jgi:thymidylate synthase (FAD)
MGKITIHKETTKTPISLIGKMAGVCWGADVENKQKNYKRGLHCISAQHGRTWEFPDIYVTISGYSARVIREFYTHIGGLPTRLQESTRYVDCTNFKYITPPSILKCEHPKALALYHDLMSAISYTITELEELGIPREDSAMCLPLGMETKIVVKINLRAIVEMSHQRMCARAYWEYRNMMKDLREALADYSDEWATLVCNLFEPKCKYLGYCPEEHSCGRAPKKSNN